MPLLLHPAMVHFLLHSARTVHQLDGQVMTAAQPFLHKLIDSLTKPRLHWTTTEVTLLFLRATYG